MDELDDTRKEAYRSFITAHAAIYETIDRQLTDAGFVPLAWYDVLVTLEYQSGHGLRMSELAERVLLSKSGLTRLIDRLVEAGLVSRAYCPSDRRGTYAVLTDAGRKAREAAWPLYSSLIQRLFGSCMTDDEAASVRRVMDRAVAAVGDLRKSPVHGCTEPGG